jgi:hypothetical protein
MNKPPNDFYNPSWSEVSKIHDWKNYVSDDLKSIWITFSDEQRQIIAANFNEMASREEWD